MNNLIVSIISVLSCVLGCMCTFMAGFALGIAHTIDKGEKNE